MMSDPQFGKMLNIPAVVFGGSSDAVEAVLRGLRASRISESSEH